MSDNNINYTKKINDLISKKELWGGSSKEIDSVKIGVVKKELQHMNQLDLNRILSVSEYMKKNESVPLSFLLGVTAIIMAMARLNESIGPKHYQTYNIIFVLFFLISALLSAIWILKKEKKNSKIKQIEIAIKELLE